MLLPLRPPNYAPWVLIAAGRPPAAQQSAEMIDLSAPVPAWTALPDLNQARPEQCTACLPAGKVFLAGGVTGAPGAAEIFDPENPAAGWLRCADLKHIRCYHSSNILLADGSVLMGGDSNGDGDGDGGRTKRALLPRLLLPATPYNHRRAGHGRARRAVHHPDAERDLDCGS